MSVRGPLTANRVLLATLLAGVAWPPRELYLALRTELQQYRGEATGHQQTMPWVFSYGSLQKPAVQLATFGRVLEGNADALVGFELGMVRHGDKSHANVTRSERAGNRVPGMAFKLTDAELLTADQYERADAYTRIAVSLASGVEAWVYVEAASLT